DPHPSRCQLRRGDCRVASRQRRGCPTCVLRADEGGSPGDGLLWTFPATRVHSGGSQSQPSCGHDASGPDVALETLRASMDDASPHAAGGARRRWLTLAGGEWTKAAIALMRWCFGVNCCSCSCVSRAPPYAQRAITSAGTNGVKLAQREQCLRLASQSATKRVSGLKRCQTQASTSPTS